MYFKVVQTIKDELYSSSILGKYPYIVKYRVGEWVKAAVPGTGLFVFEGLENALAFAQHFHKIFSCEIKEIWPSARLFYPDESFHQYMWAKVRNLHYPKNNISSNHLDLVTIKGTVQVEEVCLMTEIKR